MSKLICWQTRSKYSHAALILDDDSVIEAWHRGGVLHNQNISIAHTPGTQVDVFQILPAIDQSAAIHFARAQVGRKYDFGSIFRFISRRPEPHDEKWFCSELVAAACKQGGVDLLNGLIPHSHLSPRDIGLSPYLRKVNTLVSK